MCVLAQKRCIKVQPCDFIADNGSHVGVDFVPVPNKMSYEYEINRGYLWEKKKLQLLLLYLVCFWCKMVPFAVSKQLMPLCPSKFASHVCTRLHLLSKFFFLPFLLSPSFCWSPFFSKKPSLYSDLQQHGLKDNFLFIFIF